MFVDKVNVHVKGGNGGNGCVSFYRAKYITAGGPDGGDGGRGGSVFIVGDPNMNTLMDYRYKRKFSAGNGEDGSKTNCSGKDGEDIFIHVPVGTVVKEASSGKVMADITKVDERKLLIAGGKGGKGNQHFATPTRQAPRFAEKGRLAKAYDIVFELKLIADVGIIGFPNVGKSSLLKMVTNANPKIANYHFTTLSPNLGVVRTNDGLDFVMADIPGLIEGAHEGVGLGHAFLRHIERTKVFIHVVDAACLEGGDPVENVALINKELGAYNPALLNRPQVIAANKIDIPEAALNVERLKQAYERDGVSVFPISAAANLGLNDLIAFTGSLLKNYPEDIVFEEDYEEFIELPTEQLPFEIDKVDEDYFEVFGPLIDRLVGYTSLDTEKGFAFFQNFLRDRGIIAALVDAGIAEGDTVKISNIEFIYYP